MCSAVKLKVCVTFFFLNITMALPLPGKRKGELYIESCLRIDIEAALLTFLNNSDVSFSHFKTVWRTSGLNLIHQASTKERVDHNDYMQIVFYVILSLLNRPAAFEDTTKHRLQSLQNTSERSCIWNIGVVYCLYAMYHTQECSKTKVQLPSATSKQPINIGPDTATSLMKAAEQFMNIAEFGSVGLEIYKALWKDGAFRCCAYSGPSSMYFSQRAFALSESKRKNVARANFASTVHAEEDTSESQTNTSSSSASSQSTAALLRIREHYRVYTPVAEVIPAGGWEAAPVTTATPSSSSSSATVVNGGSSSASSIQVSVSAVAATVIVPVSVAAPSLSAEGVAPVVEAVAAPPSAHRGPLMTELLAQSIQERRQKRADKVQQRKDQAQKKVNVQKEKLKEKFLKRMEVETAAPSQRTRSSNATSSRTAVVELEPEVDSHIVESRTKNRPKPTPKRKYVLQNELPVDEALNASAGSAGKLSLEAAFPARTAPPRLQPMNRRSGVSTAATSSAQRENISTRTRTAGNTRVAAAGSDHVSDDGNADLIDSFEEFVGLRTPSQAPPSRAPPRGSATRVAQSSRPLSASTSAATSTARLSAGASSRSKGTPASSNASAKNKNTPQRQLDADSGDIMDILNQLESESAAVLQRGVGGRTRSSAATTSSAPTSSTDSAVPAVAEPPSKRARGAGAPEMSNAPPVVSSSSTARGASAFTSFVTTLATSVPSAVARAVAAKDKNASKSRGANKTTKKKNVLETKIVAQKYPSMSVGCPYPNKDPSPSDRDDDSDSSSASDSGSDSDAPPAVRTTARSSSTTTTSKSAHAAATAVAVRKQTKARVGTSAAAGGGENAEVNLLDMLQRLEQESQAILHGSGGESATSATPSTSTRLRNPPVATISAISSRASAATTDASSTNANTNNSTSRSAAAAVVRGKRTRTASSREEEEGVTEEVSEATGGNTRKRKQNTAASPVQAAAVTSSASPFAVAANGAKKKHGAVAAAAEATEASGEGDSNVLAPLRKSTRRSGTTAAGPSSTSPVLALHPAGSPTGGPGGESENMDIMALLGRLEQESSDVLQIAQRISPAGSSAETAVVSAQVESTARRSLPTPAEQAREKTSRLSRSAGGQKASAKTAHPSNSPTPAVSSEQEPSWEDSSAAELTTAVATAARNAKKTQPPQGRRRATSADNTTSASAAGSSLSAFPAATSAVVGPAKDTSSKRVSKKTPFSTADLQATSTSAGGGRAGPSQIGSSAGVGVTVCNDGEGGGAEGEDIMDLLAQLEQQASVILSKP